MATNDFENEDFEIDEWGDPVKKRRKEKAASNQSGDPPVDEWGDPVSSIPVEREMQEYYSEREKMSLEKRLVAEGKIYPRAHYMPRGRFRGIVAVCLAFVFGMFISLGALVGTGFFIGKSVKIKSLLGDKASEYLTEDYLDMSIVDLISTVAKDVAGGNLTDLNGIAKYTPVVDTLIGKLNDTISQYGITLDAETLKSTKFTNYATYFMDDVAKNIELGKVVQLKQGSNPLLLALCYGEEGIDYSFGANGEIIPIETGRSPLLVGALMEGPMEAFRDLRLGTMLGISTDVTDEKLKTNALMFALAYGKRGVDYKVENGRVVVLTDDKEGAEGTFSYPTTIGDLIDGPNEVINTLELGAMLGIDTDVTDASKKDNALMYSLCYGVEGKDYKVENGTIIPLDGRDPQYPTTVKQLTESSNAVVNGLELGAMLGIASGFTEDEYKSNTLMYSIAYGNEGTDYTVNWENGKGTVVMLEGHEAKTVEDLTTNSNELINNLELGTMLGIASGFTEDEYKNNTLMYSIAYGNEGTDYRIDWENGKGKVVMLEGSTAKTVKDLTENSNELINGLELGTMLGIGTDITEEDKKNNALMLSICYGKEGEDYDVVKGKVVMREGHSATTVGELTENSNKLIQKMEVETLMEVTPQSDKLMHYLAYGNEMAKGTAPYTKQADGTWKDAKEKKVDASGYLLAEDGSYLAEFVKGAEGNPTTEKQYVGSGKYIYIYETEADGSPKKAEDGSFIIKEIQMLPDPNKADGSLYPKRTVADLTKENAGILDGMKIGDVMEIDSESSGLMQALKDWTLDDLSDQKKINGLHLNEILDINDSSSGIMRAMENWTLDDLSNQAKIEELTIGQVLDIKEEDEKDTSKIMWALRDKTLADLEDQNTINDLKLSDVLDIHEADPTKQDDKGSSGILLAMKDWKLNDLNDQEQIEGLTIGEVLDIKEDGEKDTSKIMWALRKKSLKDLEDQNTINSLKLGDILEIGESSSGIMNAMKDWQLSDLSNQHRIERLRIGQIINVSSDAKGLMAAIKNWRIGDLSKQENINSLTLGDVIDIADDETGILAALKDAQIGNMQAKINTLTLKEILGNSFGNNAILNLLANSTIATLADDMTNITIGELFADEVYSYMEVKEESGEKLTYQKLYDDYSTNHALEETAYKALTHTRPEAVTFTTENPLITTYQVGGKAVTKGYFEKLDDSTYARLPENTKVIRKVIKNESDDTATTMFVYQKETELTVIKTFQLVSYDEKDGSVKYSDLPAGVDGNTLIPDQYGNYSYTDSEQVTHEVDCLETYELNGKSYKESVLKKDGKAYCVEEVEVIERYAESKSSNSYAATELYEESGVETVYQHKDASGNVVELEQYLSGIWFLLLGHTSDPTSEHAGGEISFNANVALLDIAKNITKIDKTLTDCALWKLYFHEILPEDPYCAFAMEIPFDHKTDSATVVHHTVKNLNDVTISELVPLIEALTSESFLRQYLTSLTTG